MNASLFKLEIYVPESHFDVVCQALWTVDAGHIGKYDRCLSWSEVNSSWRPLEGSKPFLGTIGRECWARERKIEVCCLAQRLEETLHAVKNAHPYEEPVINVLPMAASGI